MKKFVFLSLLFAAMLVPNNSVKAQPESFTQNFIQEDYRDINDGNGEQLVRTNVVTVVWDADADQMIFYNYYKNTDIVNKSSAVVNLILNGPNSANYGTGGSDYSVTSLTWISDTKATFTWRMNYLGKTTKSGWTGYPHACVCHLRKNSTRQTATIYNGVNYYDASARGSDLSGEIDLDEGRISINGPWGLIIGAGGSWTQLTSSRIVEGFDRSVMTATNLVDIVNDGEPGKEYTVHDDLVGIATVDGVLSAPMGVSRNQNTFMIDQGKYKLDFDLSNNTLTVSQSAEDITGFVNNGSYPTYYVLGEANSNTWNPTVGQPMETTDGVHYSAVVNFDGRDNGKNYFSLTSGLAQNNDDGGWNYVNNNCRLGPASNDYPVAMGDVLFAKDMGKYKYPSVLRDGQDDFMGRVAAEYAGDMSFHPASSYDQSNWVMLTGVTNANNYVGKIIKGRSVTGTLVDKVNPTIAVSSNPKVGESSQYEPNLYIMPSFNEAYYAPESNYFFVAPKVQEYAYITWACYNAADGKFYVPNDGNDNNLSGGIAVNWDYLPNASPTDGYVYEFDAILRKVPQAASNAPMLRDGAHSTPNTDAVSADYLVYPLRLYDVPTAIKTVEATGKVVDVKYYNMMGIESSTPFSGVNIIVTTYDNGTRTTSKKLYK